MLFQWNSADHVPYSESEQPLPASPSTPWDWFHINAVHLDTDGNLLIDARDTWTTYEVNRHTGDINWQLGGKDSSFTAQAAPGQTLDNAGEIFAWQHDPEALGHDEYTFFDNESAGTPKLPNSRAMTVKLDPWRRTATLVASDDQPEGLSAPSQGNAQTPATATCSSAGARCPTSRSSTRQASSCSTPSSRPASTPTAPTSCRGTCRNRGSRGSPARPAISRSSHS